MSIIELPAQITAGDVKEFVTEVMYPEFTRIKHELDKFRLWVTGRQPYYLALPVVSEEKRALQELARTPWLGLAVNTLAQCLFVDGYRSDGSDKNSEGPWRTWNANDFQTQQIGIHRAALTYGYSYARALRGTAFDGSNQAVFKALSPRRALCFYEDPVSDPYPLYAIEILPNNRGVRMYDANVYYDLPFPFKNLNEITITPVEHNVGVTPFVRYVNQVDLDGYCMGEVEYLIQAASRIDKTDFDLMLAQHYNSWKVRWATGIDDLDSGAEEFSAEDAERAKLILQHDSLLAHGSDKAAFGTLDETDLSGLISAHDSSVESFAANAQLPAYAFGHMSNLSADTLAAANWGMTQKLFERQMTFGSGHNKLNRLGCHIEGDVEGAKDFSASCTWQDMSVRSLAQAVDAWGKAATMLAVPKEGLWPKLPGVTQSEAKSWKAIQESNDPMAVFNRYWGAQAGVDLDGKLIKSAPAEQPKGVPGNDPSSR
ncbi:phage portal protein [Mycobacteroides abscessus]|uniref:phage portal protein n=1 Tax=Mycobacteroides abscessus TaxID=36809 RepID=UPI000D3E1218|nr:phage portal protein [Mycobacteroides abscessus]PVB19742.1 hypothetical protein DDJ40_08260 [Mycobacteroides abscessus]RIU40345.1 phage portal protein [Mycobacteroides abscessus]